MVNRSRLNLLSEHLDNYIGLIVTIALTGVTITVTLTFNLDG